MKRVLLAIAGALALYGCGGGGGGTSSESELTPTLKKGVFIDSAVEGLEYQTKSRKGLTGADGSFLYESDGETIEFFIGGKPVGFAYANPVVHVYDVSIGSTAFGGPNPARLAQLLQTLDADGNSANGIQLTSAMTSAVAAVPSINIAASDAEWSFALNSLAATIGKPVVSLEQATAHADSTLAQSNCVVADATYPFVDVYNVGKFSTSGMSCLRKARATAFFEDVYSRMDGDRSEILNSPYITKGEVLAQGEVERIARSNFVSQIGKTITDQIDTRIAFLESETSKQKFALFVSGSAKLVKDIDQFAASLCENFTQCTKSDQFAGEMFPVIMDVMSNSTACVTGKVDKCSETLASSAEIGALITKSYGNLSAETTAQFFKLVSAWVAVGVDFADSVKDPKPSFNFVGSFIDTSFKSATGFYFRTSEESARRTAFINNLEIAGEAIKTWSVCASALKFPTLEQSNKCLSETIDYANKRAAEITAYSFAIMTADDLTDMADDILVAQSVMSEIMRHDGFQGALRAHAPEITFDPNQQTQNMRLLVLKVAAKYRHGAARKRYAEGFLPGIGSHVYADRVISNLNSYNALVKSKAAAILQGRYTNCSSAALGNIQTVGLVASANFDVLQLNKEAVFTADYNPSPSIRGFLVEDESGSGWVSGVPNVTRMHDTLGAKKVSFTPIIRGVNGGERICASQQKTRQYMVVKPESPVSDFVASLESSPNTLGGIARVGDDVYVASLTQDRTATRRNPDGSVFYKSSIVLTKISSNAIQWQKTIATDRYLWDSASLAQMAIIASTDGSTVRVVNSSYIGSGYNMTSSVYNVNLATQAVTPTLLFTAANSGWFPYFSDAGRVNHFSYSGYLRCVDSTCGASVNPSAFQTESENRALTLVGLNGNLVAPSPGIRATLTNQLKSWLGL